MRHRPDPWGSFWVEQPLQPAWDAAALQAEAEPRVQHGPTPLQNDGKVKVRVRTAPGDTVPVWVP
jgi:hypothetical protein